MLPALFVGHGGGPLPLLEHPSHEGLIETWAPGGKVHELIHDPSVKAIVVVSAHHESADGAVEVMGDEKPALLFDYGGFPPVSYTYELDNPGSPHLSQRVLGLLQASGISTRLQTKRGHDHGVFVPLLGLGIEKRPTLPVISVSIRGPGTYRPNLSADHVEMGKALEPLRGEGVLILGSGNSIHGRCTFEQTQSFDGHLRALASEGPAELTRWHQHPMAKICHRRPEHLIPLLVCAGAALDSTVELIRYTTMNEASCHFLFQ